MPSDVVGTNVFNSQTQAFNLKKGPIFTDILLADEINRTPPKTQAALLEAMQEKRVTIDGETHVLSPLFTVLATQNRLITRAPIRFPKRKLTVFCSK
jgi:MoxR-like ATPase